MSDDLLDRIVAFLREIGIEVVSGLFPFRPTLRALDATLNDTSRSVAGPFAHLVALTIAYAAVARLALRRFA